MPRVNGTSDGVAWIKVSLVEYVEGSAHFEIEICTVETMAQAETLALGETLKPYLDHSVRHKAQQLMNLTNTADIAVSADLLFSVQVEE